MFFKQFFFLDRQLNLLSFGEEAEEFEEPVGKKAKMKSTYDFMENATPTPTDLLEELKKEPEPKKVTEKQSIQEKLKEKVRASEEKRKRAMEEEKEKEKVAEIVVTPSEERSSTIEKLKQDIRNISKVEQEAPVQKKEKKKSLVEQEREKYATNKKTKRKASDKVDDSDVSEFIIFSSQ